VRTTTAGRIHCIFVICLTVAGTGFSQESRHPYRPGFDVLHYDFSLTIPDTGSYIRGTARIAVKRFAPEPVLRLDLIDLLVTGVRVDDHTVALHRDSTSVSVALAGHAVPDTFVIDVQYEGFVRDGLIMRKTGSRWTAFGDNWPDRARFWLPAIDHPSDKATVTWNIDAPAGRTVIANGALIESSPVGDQSLNLRRKTVWRSHRPIPTYLMVIAVAPLVSTSLGIRARGLSEFGGGVQQTVYTAPEDREYMPGPFDRAGDIVEFFCRTIGPFPYEKLDHVQSSTKYGGMENASIIFYYDEGFRRRQINTSLIAHETAHQWFGDAVTPLDWPHLWLSEGFATYWTELWRRHDEGDSAFRGSMANMRAEIIRSQTTARRPIIDTAETNLMALLNSNSYQKGAWVLHMLRATIGDTAFYKGMRQYYEQYRHQSALSSDFRRSMEASSGTELAWFFDQWLRRPGYIRTSLQWEYRENLRAILLTIKQDASAPPYRFLLRLAITEENSKPVTTAIEIPAMAETVVRIPWNGGRPSDLTFDPLTELLWTVTEVRNQSRD